MKIYKMHISKKNIVLLFGNLVLLVLFLVVSNVAKDSQENYYSQQVAKRWESEKNTYAQVSAFISPGRDYQTQDIDGIRSSLLEKMTKDAMNDGKSKGRIWIDAYSGQCEASVWRETNTLSVTAVGVGGDFFLFHPIPLRSGSYITEEDLNQDRVLVDENFAWAMFGSNDIVGMQIWMNDTIFTVAGVVAVDEDSLYRTAYGKSNRIYLPYEQLKAQQEQLRVECYETVMPNPITNYAYYAVREACGIEDASGDNLSTDENPLDFGDIEVIENSNRYGTISLYEKWKNRKYRVMRTTTVAYPFWENLARVEESKQINLFVVRFLLLIGPIISVIVLLIYLWKHRKWTVKGLLIGLVERYRERQEEKVEKELNKEDEKTNS